MDIEGVRNFLFNRGVSTKTWPNNGLNVDENRALFASALPKNVDEAVSLVLRGLSNIDWLFDR